ncbi:MAG: HIT family protein [Candidatus Delongbacteria bacterium]|nr:HIT family protein [Candidatus Delongbacteria bacterium]MBN2834108.1 HIT family protein [Candidatus Delongbacteria bacterium]
MNCKSCDSNNGIKRISPGDTIFEGKYWLIEHAYPTSLKGWTVIVLKRHCEEMHNLSTNEFQELATIQEKLVKSLKNIFDSKREYIFCFAEADGFKHIHFHVVPKHDEFNEDFIGVKVFHYLKPTPEEVVPNSVIIDICDKLKNEMTHF